MANTPLGRTVQMIRGSPVMQARAAALRAAFGPALDPLPVQRAAQPNPTGLPDGLKAEVEARSGLAMDDVRVHRNSPRPAQLEALAYAQGTDIHLAPGQERHLPHEAWHVVQQKQGRVAPTLQVNGVAVNDDAALEREADAMGAEAPGPARAGPAGADRTVQRRVLRHKPNEVGKDLEGVQGVAGALDVAVDAATGIIKANPALKGADKKEGGYLDAWTKVFAKMLEENAIPEFFYARYGYAVETIATGLIGAASFGTLKVDSQVSAGATRPDFVVSKGKDQLGWLDVTSEKSKGHIFKKQHSGWKSRPYVAEILYPTPGVSDFSKSGNLSEKQKAALAGIETKNAEDELNYDNGIEALAIVIQDALEDEAKRAQLTKTATKKVVTEALKGVLGDDLTGTVAGQILGLVEVIEVNGEKLSGANWATWAFEGGGYKAGRQAIIKYGASLAGEKESGGEGKDKPESKKENKDEEMS
ncbi:MAG: DUF4157 domain-containing protein [Roseiarcus sp.]